MQRQLCIKLLSKFTQNSSPLLNKIPNPFSQQSFSHHSTLSRSNLWNGNGVLGKTGYGFSKSPVLSQRFFSNAFSKKGQSKDSIFTKVWIQSKRKFHSFDSQQGGWRSYLRNLTPDRVVIGLVVANAGVFMLWKVADTKFMVENFMLSIDNVKSGRLHTVITSAFSHRDPWHLFSNMLGLYFFGLSIGRNFGSQYLLRLYLSGAVVGSIFYLAYQAYLAQSFQGRHMFGADPSKSRGLGASGAVNAILLLDIFLFPTKTILFGLIIPVPAILFGAFIIGKDLMRILEGDTEVSGSAHLGGATVAAIAWAQIRRGRFRRF